MNEKVSVIVPVYNGEKYIRRCLDSIINQTYKSLEIIVINNNSSDGTGEIVKRYSEVDNRIVVLEENKAGVSNARNKGLAIASGKYVVFVDVDDYLDIEAIESEVRSIENSKSDIVFFDYYNNIRGKEEIIKGCLKCKKYTKDRCEVIENMSGGDYFSSIWRGMYRTDLIRNNNVVFRNIKFAEDLLFNIECIDVAESVFVSDETYYHYIDNEESSLKKLQYDLKNAVEFINELGKLVNSILNHKDYEKIYISELKICLERILNIAKTYGKFKHWIGYIELANISRVSNEYILVKNKKYSRLFRVLWTNKIKRKIL